MIVVKATVRCNHIDTYETWDRCKASVDVELELDHTDDRLKTPTFNVISLPREWSETYSGKHFCPEHSKSLGY